ncbi:MAG: putative DNA-binding domain-containing protein [Pseudomonadales bacterium]|nr:putative DNA-binding domain-containing protein [Pseudomonadales bacterium]
MNPLTLVREKTEHEKTIAGDVVNQPVSLAQSLDEFTDYLRRPDETPVPKDIDERRAGIYRELVYNNIESCLSGAFPICGDILSESKWELLVSGFIAQYRAQTPYFSRLPSEFVHFIEQSDISLYEHAFLPELIRYEWVELELYLEPDTQLKPKPNGDNLEHTPLGLIAPARVEAWEYPVHKIGPEPETQTAQATYLLIHRDNDGDVHFMELQPVAYIVLTTLKVATQDNCYLSPTEILTEIVEQYNAENVTQFIQQGLALFHQLNDWGVIFDASAEPQA